MKTSAFTIIEIIAVIMVIAILVGIALPRFSGIQDEAKITKAKGELRTIQAAMESFYMHQRPNAYPETAELMDQLVSATPQLIAQPLYDPFADSQEYQYILSDNGRYYVLFSIGPDAVADIEEIDDEGVMSGRDDDDVYVTNGNGW